MSTSGATLQQISFTAGLRNAESCDITIKNVETVGGTASITLQNGRFTLSGKCDEGGTRLFDGGTVTQLLQVSPKPRNGPISIELNLVEDGVIIVSIYNSIGILKEEYRYTDKGQKKIEVNTKDYESGLYFITVQTPTVIKKGKLILYKQEEDRKKGRRTKNKQMEEIL